MVLEESPHFFFFFSFNWFGFFRSKNLVIWFHSLQAKQSADGVDPTVPRVSFPGDIARMGVEALSVPSEKRPTSDSEGEPPPTTRQPCGEHPHPQKAHQGSEGEDQREALWAQRGGQSQASLHVLVQPARATARSFKEAQACAGPEPPLMGSWGRAPKHGPRLPCSPTLGPTPHGIPDLGFANDLT